MQNNIWKKFTFIIFIVIGALIVTTHYYHEYRLMHKMELRQASDDQARLIQPSLSYLAGAKTVTIPFIFHHGDIILNATSNHQPVKCLLDTGLSYEEWPSSLRLICRKTGLTNPHFNPADNLSSRFARFMILKELKIGDLEIHNCPGAQYTFKRGDPVNSQVIRLGDDLFAHSILIIDYRKKYISIKPADGVSLFVPHHGKLMAVIKFLWNPKRGGISPPMIMAAGKIGKYFTNIGIDTGIEYSGLVVINNQLSDELKQDYLIDPMAKLPKGEIALKNVPWNIGPVVYKDSIGVMPMSNYKGPPKAVVGSDILMDFRITIDYPLREILMQWTGSPFKRK